MKKKNTIANDRVQNSTPQTQKRVYKGKRSNYLPKCTHSKRQAHGVSCLLWVRTLQPNRSSSLQLPQLTLSTPHPQISDPLSSRSEAHSSPANFQGINKELIIKPHKARACQMERRRGRGRETSFSASKNSPSPFFFFFSTCFAKYLSSNFSILTPDTSTLVEVAIT